MYPAIFVVGALENASESKQSVGPAMIVMQPDDALDGIALLLIGSSFYLDVFGVRRLPVEFLRTMIMQPLAQYTRRVLRFAPDRLDGGSSWVWVDRMLVSS